MSGRSTICKALDRAGRPFWVNVYPVFHGIGYGGAWPSQDAAVRAGDRNHRASPLYRIHVIPKEPRA